MNFDLSADQSAVKRDTARFAEGLNAGLRQRDRDEAFSRQLWRSCAEFGLQGLPFPARFGGSESDAPTTVAAMEGLGYGCRDSGLIFGINAQMWSVQTPLLEFGSDEQQARYLPGLIDGSLIGAHAMTEPDAGSDAFSLSTKAERHGDEYVLNGSKIFVTNGPGADLYVAFATVDRSAGFMGVTAFVVERGCAGLEVGPPMSKLGLRTSHLGQLTFTDCVVPVGQRLGREGQGASIFNASMEWERAAILANYVGAMEHQLERCQAYAKSRRQFGQPIAQFVPVAERLALMKERLEVSRLMVYRVAWLKQTRGKCPLEAAMTKLYVSEAWTQSCLDAIRIHGAYGFLTEMDLERDLRDSVGGLIYSGTSDIQRGIIGRLLWSSKLEV